MKEEILHRLCAFTAATGAPAVESVHPSQDPSAGHREGRDSAHKAGQPLTTLAEAGGGRV